MKTINRSQYLWLKMVQNYKNKQNQTINISDEEYENIINNSEPTQPIQPVIENEYNTITYNSFKKIELQNKNFGANIIYHTHSNNIGKIVFDNNVTYIPPKAFKDCISLKSINLPKSIISIEEQAFYGCKLLSYIIIPDSVKYIKSFSFAECSSYLKYVYIGNSIELIEPYAFSTFSNSSNIKLIIIGDNIQFKNNSLYSLYPNYVYIKDSCRSQYTLEDNKKIFGKNVGNTFNSLEDLYQHSNNYTILNDDIPDNITETEYNTITYTSDEKLNINVDDIEYKLYSNFGGNIIHTFENGIGKILCENNIIRLPKYLSEAKTIDISKTLITSIEWEAFAGCTSLTSVTLGNSVSAIGSGAFSNCTSLTSIDIPNSVTSIGDYAFSDCTSLTSVTLGNSLLSIGDYAFSDCYSLISIYVPDESLQYYKTETYLSNYADKIKPISEYSEPETSEYEFIENEYNTITYTARIKLDINKNFINENNILHTFENGIGKIIFNHKLTVIDKLFDENYARYVISIDIPNSVTSIGEGAFYECTSLTSINIPNSVTSIGWEAFEGCTSLTSVTLGNSVSSIGNSVFCRCTSLTSINIPNSVTSIGNYVFYVCTSLTSIDIPNSVTSIGEGVFRRCTSLTSINIPNSVTSIGDYAFEGCTSLTSINIPNSVTSIGQSAFEGCTSLTSINIPNSVTSIGQSAFYQCYSLTSINIPNSVTSIGGSVFSDCYSLTSINIPNSVNIINDFTFNNCSSLTLIDIPSSVKYINDYVFEGHNENLKFILRSTDCVINNDIFINSNNDNLQIYVPDESLQYYKTETYLSNYTDKIKPISELDN